MKDNIKVSFYDSVADDLLKFAVIVSRYNNKWVYCRKKTRTTYEVPGGHREAGEKIEDTAKRELFEETGATKFTFSPVCVYSVIGDAEESFGMLYYAEISVLSKLPESEMEEVAFFEDMPQNLTYPLIQPLLVERVAEFRRHRGSSTQIFFGLYTNP